MVRAGAAGALAAAVAVPLLRRRLRIPAPVTIAACASGPLALAVLYPRSRKRDVGLYMLQMWAFTMVHELPYDDPDRLRSRLKTRYPIVADRALGLGRLPNARLQRTLGRMPGVGVVDRFLTWVHWLWFLEPYAALVFILVRHPDRFPRAARRLAAVFDIGCVGYFAVPDGAAVVGLRAGPDRRRGAADHGRGRGGDLARRLAADVRGARRQPVGGDAIASLRDLDDGGDLALRSRARPGRRRLGLRG